MKKQTKTKQVDFKHYLKQMGFNTFDRIAPKVANAYSDCLPEVVSTDGLERDLDFIQHETVKAKDLEKYLMLIGQYNDFIPQIASKEIVETFGENAEVIIARESSVCLYIKPEHNVWFGRRCKPITCDEYSFDTTLNMFRLWWD